MEVDEPWAGDFDLRHQLARGNGVENCLRQLSRVTPRRLRQLQRDVGRKVAMCGIARALDIHGGMDDVRGKNVGWQQGQRSLHEAFDLVFHSKQKSLGWLQSVQ